MIPSSRPVRTPNPRRGFAWLGAVVLLVLIAAAGLPAGRGGQTTVAGIEVVERQVRPAAVGPRQALALPVLAAVGAIAPVRPAGRQRSVAARGLPAPRAPTA